MKLHFSWGGRRLLREEELAALPEPGGLGGRVCGVCEGDTATAGHRSHRARLACAEAQTVTVMCHRRLRKG